MQFVEVDPTTTAFPSPSVLVQTAFDGPVDFSVRLIALARGAEDVSVVARGNGSLDVESPSRSTQPRMARATSSPVSCASKIPLR